MDLVARAGTAADHPSFARLFPELAIVDPLPSADEFAATIAPRMMVVERGGRVVGYSFWRLYSRTGHVVHLVVAPEARRLGAGRTLMDEVRRRLVDAGCTRWYLNVKVHNAPALRLYEQSGMVIEQRGWAFGTAWSALASSGLSVPCAAAAASVVKPSDDLHFEAALRIEEGRLAMVRQKAGVVLAGIREDGRPVAFAAFDPAFPGIYPVRLARLDLAGPLFGTLRAWAQTDALHVFVEGDGALAASLTSAGAELRDELFRMGGALVAGGAASNETRR